MSSYESPDIWMERIKKGSIFFFKYFWPRQELSGERTFEMINPKMSHMYWFKELEEQQVEGEFTKEKIFALGVCYFKW